MRAAGSQVMRVATFAVAMGAALVVCGAGPAGAQVKLAGEARLSPELASVRTGLEKYRDPMAAVRDGYFSTLACIDFPDGAADGPVTYKPGSMGVHFLNTANVGPVLDPAKPQILIY